MKYVLAMSQTSRLDSEGTEERLEPEGSEEKANAPEEHLTDEQLFKACGGRTAHKYVYIL
jgi:hypothetical protein